MLVCERLCFLQSPGDSKAQVGLDREPLPLCPYLWPTCPPGGRGAVALWTHLGSFLNISAQLHLTFVELACLQRGVFWSVVLPCSQGQAQRAKFAGCLVCLWPSGLLLIQWHSTTGPPR